MTTANPVYPQLLRDKSTQNLYFVDGICRRRIIHPEVAKKVRETYSGIKLKEVDINAISKFIPGAVVPRKWTDKEWIEPPQNKQMMREIIVSRIEGYGVEFGAGSRPMPIPLKCQVDYAEPFQSMEQYKRMNYTENTVIPKFSNPIENLTEIQDETLDFFIAAHVIEHTSNPVAAIIEAYRSLRSGGYLILVVPDMRRTFDKRRNITTLKHLIEDFTEPSRKRDLENYIDFFRYARFSKEPEREAIIAHKKGIDIHYHTWTPRSFSEMMTYIQDKYAPYRSIEIKPPVTTADCLEFYVVARK